MRAKIIFWSISFILLGVVLYVFSQQKNSFVWSLTVQEFEEKMMSQEYTIIDIRDIDELRQDGYLSWSLHIPYYASNFVEQLESLSKDDKYLIYCNRGNRTLTTLYLMESLGFKEVFHLVGWIQDWKRNQKMVYYCLWDAFC